MAVPWPLCAASEIALVRRGLPSPNVSGQSIIKTRIHGRPSGIQKSNEIVTIWTALAIMIFGRWQPFLAWAAARFFSFTSRLAAQLQFDQVIDVPPQFVNASLPQFARCMALLGRMWRLRPGLNPEQAGRWTGDFQTQLPLLKQRRQLGTGQPDNTFCR
jgi:hypothetical protein